MSNTPIKTADTQNTKPAKLGRPFGSNREQTVSKILASALSRFTQYGYFGTTYKDIAIGAEITPATIYHHFDSKPDLYLGVLDNVYKELLPKFLVVLDENNNLKDQLRGVLLAAVELHESHPEMTAFLSSVPVESIRNSELKSLLANRASGMKTIQQRMFEEAKQRGEINPNSSTKNLSMTFFGSAIGMVLYFHASEGTSMHEAVDIYLKVIDNQFFNSP